MPLTEQRGSVNPSVDMPARGCCVKSVQPILIGVAKNRDSLGRLAARLYEVMNDSIQRIAQIGSASPRQTRNFIFNALRL